MPVRLSTRISAAPPGRISVKFDTRTFLTTCRDKPDLVTVGRNYFAFCVITEVRLRGGAVG